MTIIEILSNEDITPTEKLKAISEIVSKIREKYGNTSYDITARKVPTPNGLMPLSMLSDKSKLALVEKEIKTIISIAYEKSQDYEGVVFDRCIEECIAINPILVNLNTKFDSKYL